MSRSAVSVRRVVAEGPADDLAALARLWCAARQEAPVEGSVADDLAQAGDLPGIAARLREALGAGVEVYLARAEHRDVGLLVLSHGPVLPLLDDLVLSIEQLYVVREARHTGVGHVLLAKATSRAEQIGATQIATNVPAAGREAQRFFARLGFGPYVVRRRANVTTVRRRLSWQDHPRLDPTVLRRRSLRARSRAIALRTRTSA